MNTAVAEVSMEYCGAQRRGREGTCEAPAGRGTPHVGTGRCSWHGGASPQHRQAAANQVAELRARAELAQLGINVEPITDPLAALAELAAEQGQWRQWCRERVKALDPDDIRYSGALMQTEQIRAEVQLYSSATDQSARLLIALSKAYSEDQLARITQQKAAMMSAALADALAEAGITGEQAAEVRRVYARRLRVLPESSERRALPATTQATADGALVGVVVPRVT
jgi:hypothetical protein